MGWEVYYKMNLFILSLCFRECAEWMFDKHISKMMIEAVQMLSTAKHLIDPFPEGSDGDGIIYAISHKNHPVTIWIRTSLENYMWTLDMLDAMHEEWLWRYDHDENTYHKSFIIGQYLRTFAPTADKFPQKGLTPFALAMPDEYKCADPVESYRRYYVSKKKFASWKKREPPCWFS